TPSPRLVENLLHHLGRRHRGAHTGPDPRIASRRNQEFPTRPVWQVRNRPVPHAGCHGLALSVSPVRDSWKAANPCFGSRKKKPKSETWKKKREAQHGLAVARPRLPVRSPLALTFRLTRQNDMATPIAGGGQCGAFPRL